MSHIMQLLGYCVVQWWRQNHIQQTTRPHTSY